MQHSRMDPREAGAQFAKSIRLLRETAGLKQAEVAARAGLRRELVVRAEAGENIGLHPLLRILDALGARLAVTGNSGDFEAFYAPIRAGLEAEPLSRPGAGKSAGGRLAQERRKLVVKWPSLRNLS
ncbi:MAG: helix-turn-helix transcriptional regulator [Rhodocyclaceae bacterium]|nr:helix-turn-helix transcriptional regulator [Rhodocyclaceae bacterium]